MTTNDNKYKGHQFPWKYSKKKKSIGTNFSLHCKTSTSSWKILLPLSFEVKINLRVERYTPGKEIHPSNNDNSDWKRTAVDNFHCRKGKIQITEKLKLILPHDFTELEKPPYRLHFLNLFFDDSLLLLRQLDENCMLIKISKLWKKPAIICR